MKLKEEKICALEVIWAGVKSKLYDQQWQLPSAEVVVLLLRKDSKQSFKLGGRKVVGVVTGLLCTYFSLVTILLIIKSNKIIKYVKTCYSVCSSGLNIGELYVSTSIHTFEIIIFGNQ